MKPVVTSLLIAFACSTAIAAAPDAAAPAQPQAASAEAATPSPERIDLARQFVAVTTPAEMVLDGLRQGFWMGASRSFEGIEDEAERAAVEAKAGQVLARLEPKFIEQIPGLREAYAQVYAREFSAEELRHMTAFAQSPAGKHYLSRFPYLENDPAVLETQGKLMMGVAPVLEEFTKQMCQEAAERRLAAGDTKARCPLSDEPESRSS